VVTLQKQRISEALQSLATTCPDLVLTELRVGDKVQRFELEGLEKKGLLLFYSIDNLELTEGLGLLPHEEIPYTEIYKTLVYDRRKLLRLFRGKGKREGRDLVVPYSKAWDRRVGGSLEKAIAIHLASQSKFQAFLINGLFKAQDEDDFHYYAYNVVVQGTLAMLVDAQHPLGTTKDGKIEPYIVPIIGVHKLEFQLAEGFAQGRRYRIV